MQFWNLVSLFRRGTRPSPARRRPVRLALEPFEDRVVPANISWTAGTDGNFNDAPSWTVSGTGAHRVPGPADDAFISGGVFTIDFTESHHVNSLNASVVRFAMSGSGTTLTLDNLLTSSNIQHLVLLSGTSLAVTNGSTTLSDNSLFAGNIAVAAGATLSFANGIQTLTNGAALTGAGQYLLTGATLTIAGGVTADAPSSFNLAGGTLAGPGTFNVPGGVTTTWTSGALAGPTTVASGGTFHLTSANNKVLDGATLTNNGTVNWDTGIINAGNEAVVHNDGTWNVQGDLRLVHTFQNTPTFDNEATGVYRKTAGTGNATIEGPTFNNQGGTVEVQSGNLLLGSGDSTDGTWNAVNTGSVLDLTSNGTRTISGTLTGSGAGTVRLAGGTLTVLAAGATFNFTDPLFQWTGGTIAAEVPGATLTSNSILTLAQANDKVLDGVTLVTPSTVNWTGGRINAGDEAVINNSGTWNVQGDLTLTHTFGNTPTFNNASTGVYSKTTGTGTANVESIVFNNAGGTVEVQSGNLFLPVGTSTDGTYNAIDSGSLLDLVNNNGTRDVGGTLTGSGAGTVRFSNGDLEVLATGATFSFPGSLFQWTGGTISGGGPGATLTNSDTMTLSTATDKILSAVTLVNAGTLTMSTGRMNGGSEAMISNSGTWNVEGDVSLVHTFGNSPTFNNTGTFNKDVGASTNATEIDFIFNNGDTGIVNVNSGNLLLGNGGTDTGTFNAVAGTTLQFTAGTHTLNAGATLPSAGLTQINFGATVIVTAVVSVANFGVLNGTLELTGTGILNVSGNFDLAVNGTLVIDIGGDTGSGTDSGQVNVAGTAGVAGALYVNLVNDYVPVTGDSYPLVTFGALNGSFRYISLPGLAPGRTWDQSYAAGAYTLTVIPG